MKVLFLSESQESPSTRYRLAPLARDLRLGGHEVLEHALESNQDRQSLWSVAKVCDVVVLQRRLINRFEFWRLKRAANKIIFDFDDAIVFRDRHPFESRTRARRFAQVCRAAHWVVAGNDYLQRLAQQGGARSVSVVPTSIDECVLPKSPGDLPDTQAPSEALEEQERSLNWETRPSARPEASLSPSIVWIGGRATRPYLDSLVPVFQRLAPKGGRVRVKIVADRCPEWSDIECEFTPWSEQSEWTALAQSSVGVAPLPDDAWTQGKCGLKVLQYAAVGIPAVVSPVGVQEQMVEHGQTGFHAHGIESWIESLEQLLHHPSLAREMGRRFQERVRRDYAWERWSSVWIDLLHRVLEERGS